MAYLELTTNDPVILELIFREHLLAEPGLTQFEVTNENGTHRLRVMGPNESSDSPKDGAPQSAIGT
jgi:hypothetical protein